MRHLKVFKYCAPIVFFIAAYFAFINNGLITYLPIVMAFVLMPLAELLLKPNTQNLEQAEEEVAKADKIYDYVLHAFIILMFPTIALFLYQIKINLSAQNIDWFSITGKVLALGFLCGTFGINIAHELGHRVNKFEQRLAQAGLLTSLYMHFFTEHNKGHHKNVATHNDPASSRFNENLYAFWVRTIVGSYKSAWHIANEECSKKQINKWSLKNEMVLFTIVQIAFVAFILIAFNWAATLAYLAAAIMGALLLETVNYIEHYGLSRKETTQGKFERTLPIHSWNSNHYLGRVMLFELSRHSDHHYLASRKYQILRHHTTAPQMPTGYPGMMLLSTIPPLWFKVMNPRVKAIMEAA
jgi:alkane 1-monooxygenase